MSMSEFELSGPTPVQVPGAGARSGFGDLIGEAAPEPEAPAPAEEQPRDPETGQYVANSDA